MTDQARTSETTRLQSMFNRLAPVVDFIFSGPKGYILAPAFCFAVTALPITPFYANTPEDMQKIATQKITGASYKQLAQQLQANPGAPVATDKFESGLQRCIDTSWAVSETSYDKRSHNFVVVQSSPTVKVSKCLDAYGESITAAAEAEDNKLSAIYKFLAGSALVCGLGAAFCTNWSRKLGPERSSKPILPGC